MPNGISINIEKATLQNNNYRKIIYTDTNQQIALMSLNVGENICKEKHDGSQFFRVESGVGIAVVKNKTIRLKDGISLTVPKNTLHEIINTSISKELKIYTIYSPPQHKHGKINKRQPRQIKKK